MRSTKPGPRRWYFKYGECTHAELVQFLQDRTGTTIGISMKTGRARLLSRLRELDRNPSFPHFLDLPLELRLRVHEHLLAPDKEFTELPQTRRPRPKGKIQTAVLRTSKAVYSEAELVLYKENRFPAVIDFAPPSNFTINRSGSNEYFDDNSDYTRCGWVLKRKIMRPFAPMLQGLRSLTIHLALWQAPGNEHARDASRIITRLCMLMCSGPSKMKELIFSLRTRNASSSVAVSMLPQIFWPVILLRSDIVVRFEGVSGMLGPQQSEQDQRDSQRALLPPGTAEAMCKLVADIRRCCEAAHDNVCSGPTVPTPMGRNTIDYDSDTRYEIMLDDAGGYRGPCTETPSQVDKLLRRLAPLAEIVDTVDIASGSTKWKMLQELANDAETVV
ncbi:hypothetical protein Q7P36_000337 [Cladosporium allicinum]